MALKMVPLSISVSDESTMNAGCARNILSLILSIFDRLLVYLSVIFCAHFVVPLSFFGLSSVFLSAPSSFARGCLPLTLTRNQRACKAAVCTVLTIRGKRFTLGICQITVFLWLSGLGIQGISGAAVCGLLRYCRLDIFLRRRLCLSN